MEIQIKESKIFAPLINKWLVETPEERVRQEYIKKLVNEYGYSINQMAQEVIVNNSKRGQGKARADIVIWKSEEDKKDGKAAFIVVECKSQNLKIHVEDYFQGYNYAAWAGATFFVTTNLKETKYFNINKEYLPKSLEEILAIPKADEVNDTNKILELLSQTKTFTREEFTRLLFRCHSIIRNNDKLSPEAAFDEISKVLFMKINFEKNNKGSIVFTKEKFKQDELTFEQNIRPNLKNTHLDLPYMQYLFMNTKNFYNEDKLFEENELIRIRQNSFEAILEELEKYNLSDTSDDVKGIAFEQFLGKTFRGELGQFFTPRTIVDFMTNILDPQEGETICDPTCGSGGFLIKSFEYIREKIELDIQYYKEKFKNELMGEDYDSLSESEQTEINRKLNNIFDLLNKEFEVSNEGNFESRLYDLSHNCIYGVDANSRMARTSKMNMIMHGDGHGGVHHHDGLLNVNGIFEERFDVILTNPPFGARIDKSLKITEADRFRDEVAINKLVRRYGQAYKEALRQTDDNIGNSVLSLFDTGKFTGLTEVLFMERCLKLLKKGGRMGIVLPEGILNNSNMQKVREYFEGRAKILFICSIPQDVFIAAGATVKPSLVFIKRFSQEEEDKYNNIQELVTEEINQKYIPDVDTLNIQYANRKKDKEYKECLKVINQRKEIEIKEKIKALFDYKIPIAKVEKAGITTTGAVCENELLDVEKEFNEFNKETMLWNSEKKEISYKLAKNGNLVRVIGNEEQELKSPKCLR
ncbi:MAG: methylase [Bacillales bacterium]|jgi:type I restriction enzyme M protein|nr:methylase [Bacillales bacterium]